MNAYTLVGTMSHLGAQRSVELTLPESQGLCTGRGHLSWDQRDKVGVPQAEKRQTSIPGSKVPIILNKVPLLRNTEDRETSQSPESTLTPIVVGRWVGRWVKGNSAQPELPQVPKSRDPYRVAHPAEGSAICSSPHVEFLGFLSPFCCLPKPKVYEVWSPHSRPRRAPCAPHSAPGTVQSSVLPSRTVLLPEPWEDHTPLSL